ncbi:MAG: hemerythrin domain-containing protein [Actinoallomurus sp.]
MNRSCDLISILTEDHRELRQLLTELEHLTGGEPLWRSLADLTITEMVRHSVAEEAFLYPVARQRLPEGQRIVDQEVADHGRIEQMVARLESPDLPTAQFSVLMSQLAAALGAHMQAEEDELFVLMAKHLGKEELAVLGRKAAEAKEKAPTRHHVSAPDHPLLNTIIASGTGLVERLREHLRGLYPL